MSSKEEENCHLSERSSLTHDDEFSFRPAPIVQVTKNLRKLRCFQLLEDRFIGEGHPCYIIAEIGQNHQGNLEIAKHMIRQAKECGADCVKFQKSDLQAKFTPSVLNRPYQSPHAFGKTYGEHKKFLEFTKEKYVQLKAYAESLPIHFSASAMDEVIMKKYFSHFMKEIISIIVNGKKMFHRNMRSLGDSFCFIIPLLGLYYFCIFFSSNSRWITLAAVTATVVH